NRWWTLLQPQEDVDIQRLRRPGRKPVQRHGPDEVLLTVSRRNIVLLKILVWILCLGPLLTLVAKGFHLVPQDLGADPISVITLPTGHWTLILLLVTLSVTPARRITGWNWLIRFRRLIGLFAFFYGCLHLLTYIWFDKFFDFPEMI